MSLKRHPFEAVGNAGKTQDRIDRGLSADDPDVARGLDGSVEGQLLEMALVCLDLP